MHGDQFATGRDFDEKKKNEQLRAHAHRKRNGIAYFLGLLDGKDAVDVNAEGLGVYKTMLNTMLTAMGITNRMGPAERDAVEVSAIRA